MSKITFGNKSSVISSPLPEANKITADNLNEIKLSVNSLYDKELGLGWERYFDGTHTEGSPQVLTPSQQNLITIDGASSLVSQSPVGFNPMWSANKINGIGINDVLQFRIDFKAKISNNDGSFEIFINIGGEIGLVWINSERFRKGSNIEQPFTFNSVIYTADTFLQNGGSIFINPSHEMQVYQKSILIQRTFIGR